jgi:hypothetical protein
VALVKAPSPRGRELSWAELLKRTFATEILRCPCGGRRRVTALVSDGAKAVEILEELGVELVEPQLARARGPPLTAGGETGAVLAVVL